LQVGRSHDYIIIPSPSRINIKWLNVVLDLNGILCVYKKKRQIPKGHAYVDGSRPHSGIVSYLVGSKAIFICPSYQRFQELGNVTDTTIWSFVRVATAKFVSDLLFKDLPIKPINILDYESCNDIIVHDDRGKIVYMKVKGTDKQLFLKSIWKYLLLDFDGRYCIENIIIIDDNPVKHLLNPIENVIFPNSGHL
jgi:hypothetical protein